MCAEEPFFKSTAALNNVPTQHLGDKNVQIKMVGFSLAFLIGVWGAV